MLPRTADAVIVGGGVMGLSTAYHLVRRGCRNVVVLEREDGLASQTTSCCAGGIRHQFSTPINVQMSIQSIQMLAAFGEEPGYPVDIDCCGYVFVLTEAGDVEGFWRAVEMQRRLGVNTEWLSADAVRERLPSMCLGDAVAGTFHARDGLSDPGAVANGYALAARRLGARLVTGQAVTGLVTRGGRVCEVVTPGGRIATPVVVNAAGPWAAQIGRMAGVALPIRPVQQQLLVTAPLPEIPADFPVVILVSEGLGFHREGPGLLTGLSRPEDGRGAAASAGRRVAVDPEWEAIHCEAAVRRLPCLASAGVVSRWAGLYEMTPDLHPILGHCPPVEGFYCIAGFSGHGFMHAPVSGLLLSEEILDGKAHTLDIAPLRPERFQQPGTLIERYTI